MTRRRLTRVFWLGAAAILVAAALISLVAVLKGSFSDTDAKILGTLAALLYCGAAALAGFALVDRGPARELGLVVAGLSAVTFVLFAAAIWEAWTTRAARRGASRSRAPSFSWRASSRRRASSSPDGRPCSASSPLPAASRRSPCRSR